MKITVEEKETKGRLVIWEEATELGEMTYSLANNGDLLIVDHTGVNEGHEGKGIGKALFYELVSMLRKQNKKVIPLCPFAKSMFKRYEDMRDVLK